MDSCDVSPVDVIQIVNMLDPVILSWVTTLNLTGSSVKKKCRVCSQFGSKSLFLDPHLPCLWSLIFSLLKVFHLSSHLRMERGMSMTHPPFWSSQSYRHRFFFFFWIFLMWSSSALVHACSHLNCPNIGLRWLSINIYLHYAPLAQGLANRLSGYLQ